MPEKVQQSGGWWKAAEIKRQRARLMQKMASSPFSNQRLLSSATDTTVVVGYLAALNKSVESFKVLKGR